MGKYPTGTVTFLFTDIEGVTKLAQEHREYWETLRARHHASLQSAMNEHNGYVSQIIGDAAFAEGRKMPLDDVLDLALKTVEE